MTATEVITTGRRSPRRVADRRAGATRVGFGGTIGRVLVWSLVAFNIFLVVWMILSSLRQTRDFVRNPLALPLQPYWENFAHAWSAGNFGPAFLNSILVTIVASVVVVAIAAPASYVLARSTRRVAGPLTVFFALGLGVPGQVLLIPIYVALASIQNVTGIQLINSTLGLIIVLIGLNIPFTVFLLTGFFSTLPGEIEEAAALDGAGAVRTFLTIMLPLARSGLTTALILAAIGCWNETLFSLVLLSERDSRTLPIALIQVMNAASYQGADWGMIFAGITILVLPMLLIFMWLGRRIMEGVTAGVGK